jgi:hypothetical protein
VAALKAAEAVNRKIKREVETRAPSFNKKIIILIRLAKVQPSDN